jgi:hypothetical protein
MLIVICFFVFTFCKVFQVVIFSALINALITRLVMFGCDVAVKWVLELPSLLLFKSAPHGCLVFSNVGRQLQLIFYILNGDVDAIYVIMVMEI